MRALDANAPSSVSAGDVLKGHHHPLVTSRWGRGAVDVVHHVAVLPHTLLRRLAQSSVWEQWWLAALFMALAITALLAPLWWRRRPAVRQERQVRLATAAGVAVSVVSGLLAVAVGVNTYAGYAPTWSALWGSAPARNLHDVIGAGPTIATGSVSAAAVASSQTEQSLVVRLTVPAPALHIGARPVYVYLPPGYADARNVNVRYPVLYLLHGYPGHASDWLLGGNLRRTMDTLIAAGEIDPMIVVMPQDNAGFFDDSECLNLPGREQDETYLTRTVVAAIDRSFRTVASRVGRAIGGMSAGAFCALNLGLRHLDEYAVILASEPYTDPGKALIRRVGGVNAWRANSPRFYLPSMVLPQRVALFVDAGARDRETLPTARWLADVLAARGQYVALRVAPGQSHTWTAARMELPYGLVFAAEHLSRPTDDAAAEA